MGENASKKSAAASACSTILYRPGAAEAEPNWAAALRTASSAQDWISAAFLPLLKANAFFICPSWESIGHATQYPEFIRFCAERPSVLSILTAVLKEAVKQWPILMTRLSSDFAACSSSFASFIFCCSSIRFKGLSGGVTCSYSHLPCIGDSSSFSMTFALSIAWSTSLAGSSKASV